VPIAAPVASVVIPAHNAAATLGATLGALAAQDLAGPFEVIVVDDGSSDETAAIAERSPLAPRLVRESAVGPGPARNAGAALATAPALAFTDADCMPAPGWLRAGLEALDRAELVQGAVHADPAAPAGPFDRTVWVTRETGLYECASLFCRRETFEALGGFEDWIRVGIGKPLAEDAWLGWRARRSGVRTEFCEAALVHHAVFERGLLGYAGERARLVYFPAIARKMPELRRTLFFCRVFLTPRSAAFDAAVAGGLAAAATRSPLPLAAAAPWAWIAARDAARWRRRAPIAALGGAAADAVGLAALAIGSVRARSPVL
jgi:glycosyltransferase involved in cell wall biosynthesis